MCWLVNHIANWRLRDIINASFIYLPFSSTLIKIEYYRRYKFKIHFNSIYNIKYYSLLNIIGWRQNG